MWFSHRVVSQVDNSSGTVFVTDTNVHKIRASLEYTRVAITDDALASHILQSIEKLDVSIDDALNIKSVDCNGRSCDSEPSIACDMNPPAH